MRSNYCLGTGNQNQLSSVNIVAVFVFGSIVQYNQISLLCKIVRIKNHPTMLETYFLKPYGNEHEKAERISLKEESGNMDVGCIKRKFILKLYCCSAAHSDEVSESELLDLKTIRRAFTTYFLSQMYMLFWHKKSLIVKVILIYFFDESLQK